MTKLQTRVRVSSRYLFVLMGIALLAYLVFRAGPNALLQNAKSIGWGLALVIGLAGVSHVVKTWAWRLTLSGETHSLSFSRMFGLRLVSEAIGQLGLPGQLVGEATRVALLGPEVPLSSRILSVTLDRGLFIATSAVVTIAGILIALAVFSVSGALRIYAALFAICLVGLLGLTVWAVRNRWLLLSGPAHKLDGLPWLGKRIQSKKALIHSIEEKLLEFHRQKPAAFWGSLALNFACHALAISEVYLILFLLRARVSVLAALILEALTKVVNIIGAFNPGNIGTYEGGIMVAANLFGLTGAIGLTLGLCRRLRGLFWAAVGAFCFVVLSRSTKRRNTSSIEPSSPTNQTLSEGPESREQSLSPAKESVAIILAADVEGHLQFAAEIAPVGSVPILLRAILAAHSTRARCIVVVPNLTTKIVLRRALLRTGRFPEHTEWVNVDTGYSGLAALLGEVGSKSDRIVLMLGNRIYNPSLLQKVNEWDGSGGAFGLVTGSQHVGIYALSREAAIDVSKLCATPITTLEGLHESLSPRHAFVLKAVEENLWQSVDSPQDRLVAERKLDSWLVKPTDGIFARMNRRVSIPISRQLIKFPFTPNMVTLFTLGVSFAAGLFFAFGGYWNSVAGALLSVCASILDGCDGEVARLKLQVSKFGCWLETVCDYLYYLFIFAGMSMGFAKSQGSRSYLVWGGVFLFGAVASFLAVGSARRRLASNNPERFLDLWQKKAEKQQSNRLMYVARNTEFIIRRCFLPYALLAFALLNVLRIAFVASAIGVNLVWPIALYSSWVLSVNHGSSPLNSAPPRVRERLAA